MSYDFSGKVALITGGNSGIGLATAKGFLEAGAQVAITGSNPEKGAKALDELDAGDNAIFIKCDVRQSSDIKAMVETVESTFGRLDYAFNNAGVGHAKPFLKIDEDEWDLVMDVNLKGVYLSMKYEIPLMKKSGGKAIVNMASIAGVAPGLFQSLYCASKYGVVGMSKVVAREVARNGIRVNVVAPGFIATPMTDVIEQESMAKLSVFNRVGEVDEVANPVLFLCSEQAAFMTGTVLEIDGGSMVNSKSAFEK